MSLTPEQKQTVAGWIAAGDGLAAVQKRLAEQFKLSMTYRDVRFLVDDLNLELKDPAPKVDTSDVSKSRAAAPAGAAPSPGLTGKTGPGGIAPGEAAPGGAVDDEGSADELEAAGLPEDEPPAGAPASSGVSVTVDKVTLIPGALASGTVTFGDGVTGKWIVDQYGRPGFTQVSQPGYRPSPADSQAFMQELSRSLQQRGF